jgi:Protein of unknown function (DUF669)
MPDISALGELKQIEPLDLSSYVDNKRSEFKLLPKGEYDVQAPEKFDYTRTQKGDLSIDISPKVIESGVQLKYSRISAKQWKNKDGADKSQVGDYLRAFGRRDKLTNELEVSQAIESTANLTYKVFLDWEANHGKTRFRVKGMTNFPKLADGTYQSWVEHPSEKNPDGTPLRLRANLVITNFVPLAD